MQKVKFILISSLIILTLSETFAEIADNKATKQGTSTGESPEQAANNSHTESFLSAW